MKIGFTLPRGYYLPKLVRKIEKVGFNSIWIGDTYNTDIFITASMIVHNTKKVKVFLCNTNPYSRNPALIALATASLQKYSNGRVVLAIGAGGPSQLSPLGIKGWNRPLTAVREAVQIVDSLLKGEEIAFHGKMFHIENLKLNSDNKFSTPILVAAIGPKMINLAAKIADGVAIAAANENYARFAAETIRKQAKGKPKIIAVQTFFCESKKSINCSKLMKPTMAEILLDDRFEPIIEKSIFRDEILKLKQTIRSKDSMVKAITNDIISDFTVFGSPARCVEKINSFMKAGVTHLSLIPICNPTELPSFITSYQY